MPMGMSEKSEEDFEAEADVRTLAMAMEIKNDSARFDRAMRKAKEQMEALEALNSDG